MVCLERATGKQLYDTELFRVDNPCAVNLLNSYATPTPVIEFGRLYCDFGTFGTACLNSDSGEVLWKRQLPLEHYQGPGSSPALYLNLDGACDGTVAQQAASSGMEQSVQRAGRPVFLRAHDRGK